jgi:hypothetical protein
MTKKKKKKKKKKKFFVSKYLTHASTREGRKKGRKEGRKQYQYCYINFSSIEDDEKCPNRGGFKRKIKAMEEMLWV